jgi:hypothetical protein
MPKKKRSIRVSRNEDSSATSDISSASSVSRQLEETNSQTSDTESASTATPAPKIRFRSGPSPKKSAKRPTFSAREPSKDMIKQPSRSSKVARSNSSASSSSGSESEDGESHLQRRQRNSSNDEPLDQDKLLSRISSAIPDLHLLLNKYKATHGELSVRDQLRQRSEAQTAELVRSKESTITALMSQLEDAAKRRADESGKHRSRIAALEISNAQLKDQAHTAELRAKALEEHLRRAIKANEDLAGEKMIFIRRAGEDKERSLKRLEKDLTSKHEQKMKEMKDSLESQITNQKEKHDSEMKETQEKHDDQLSTQKSDLEAKLSKAEDDIKILGCTDSELKDKYEADWKVKEEELLKKHEADIEQLNQKHKDYCTDQIRGFLGIQENLNKALVEENMALKEIITDLKASSSASSAPLVEDTTDME